MSSLHRRKSSKEESEDSSVQNQEVPNIAPIPSPVVPTSLVTPPSPSRSRVHSSPSANLPPLGPGIASRNKPQPAPLGAGIPARRPPSVSLNTPPTSPLRTSFTAAHARAHSRTRSISSGPFVPSSLPSPLQTSFQPLHVPLFPFPTSNTSPDLNVGDAGTTDARVPPPGHTRRHSRLHSRNLSIFFPRPHATISEDDRPEDEEAPAPPPPESFLIPTALSEPALAPNHSRGELDASFTFGGIPKSESAPDGLEASEPRGIKTRRGHHHKHSMSHNFFSFLDPGQAGAPPTAPSKSEGLQTAPTPTPLSPWSPISNTSLFSSSNLSVPDLIPRSNSKSPGGSSSWSDSQSVISPSRPDQGQGVPRSGGAAAATALLQLILGAFLWACGQSIGSLACTGLGYWVVFDAVGVAGPVLVSYQHGNGSGTPARRGTTLLFAQCVYLMFSGIYVAKEAVEHILLAAGNGAHGHGHGGNANADGGDGHHHHWGDEKPELLGLRFPVFLIFLVLLSLVGTSIVFEQHNVLANITNKHIPSPGDFFRRHRHAMTSPQLEPTSSAMMRLIRNPYALPPILFCTAILGAELILDVSHYAPFDLGLAAMQVAITIHVAYAACVVLGGVLLQTAPPMTVLGPSGIRGSGRMEAFWRIVREIERHEHVVHLPAPHVWQVVPPGQPRSVESSQEPHTYTNGNAHHDHDHSHDPRNYSLEHEHDHKHRHWVHSSDTSPTLIITLSPQVRKDLSDSDVLALTQWACARVHGAFGSGPGSLDCGKSEIGEVEVTVGVVRG
ncbi:hypothetical protein V8B97DRAFT_2061682 [Scleroderma yunnanense]